MLWWATHPLVNAAASLATSGAISSDLTAAITARCAGECRGGGRGGGRAPRTGRQRSHGGSGQRALEPVAALHGDRFRPRLSCVAAESCLATGAWSRAAWSDLEQHHGRVLAGARGERGAYRALRVRGIEVRVHLDERRQRRGGLRRGGRRVGAGTRRVGEEVCAPKVATTPASARARRLPGACVMRLATMVRGFAITAWYDAAVKQRVLFARAAGGGAMFVAPSFGRCCVCCNADAMGRVQDGDPSIERFTGAPVRMPVCTECEDHAMQSAFVPRLQGLLVTLGLLLCVIGAYYLTRRPHDHFLWGMVAVSGVSFVAGLLWLRATSRRDRREQIDGHHVRLAFSVVRGRMLLDTWNEELVRELVARNPGARVLSEPPLSRWMRQRQLPAARVIRSREP